jgi:hypothetical protein
MNILEARKAMEQGHKVIHNYFSTFEYLYMVDGVIRSEEGYDFSIWFYAGDPWKNEGWGIKE